MLCGLGIRKSISCGGRIVEIAFVEWPGVAGSLAQHFIKLILKESAHEISDHVGIDADVVNGSNIQILDGITFNWWRHPNHSSSMYILFKNLCFIINFMICLLLFGPIFVIEFCCGYVASKHAPAPSILSQMEWQC